MNLMEVKETIQDFRKQYVSEENEFPVDEETVRIQLAPYYKDIDLCILAMKANPHDNMRTPFAFYHYAE